MYDGTLRGFDTDGSPLDGLMTLNGKTYYLESGRVRTGSVQVGEDFYTFDDNGVLQTGWVQNRNGYTYYYGEDGKMVRGFVTLEGKKYYLNPAPRTGSFSVRSRRSPMQQSTSPVTTPPPRARMPLSCSKPSARTRSVI